MFREPDEEERWEKDARRFRAMFADAPAIEDWDDGERPTPRRERRPRSDKGGRHAKAR